MEGEREVQEGGDICILIADSQLLHGSKQHDIVKQLCSNKKKTFRNKMVSK